jgi:hypothetical protein
MQEFCTFYITPPRVKALKNSHYFTINAFKQRRKALNFDNPAQAIAQCGVKCLPLSLHAVGVQPICSTHYGVAVGGVVASPRTALSLVRGYQNCTPYGVG